MNTEAELNAAFTEFHAKQKALTSLQWSHVLTNVETLRLLLLLGRRLEASMEPRPAAVVGGTADAT